MVIIPVSMKVVTYRDLTTLDDFAAVVDLERRIWGPGYGDVVPLPILAVSVHRGGILIGAFEGERMIGFVYSMPGIKDGKATQWSHMLGVVDEFRQAGTGYRLKLLQRDRALAIGVDLIEWTYDPLQAANAHLNFARLGVVVDEYLENVYGESGSPLHQGNPTDRFVAEWFIREPRAAQRDEGIGRRRGRRQPNGMGRRMARVGRRRPLVRSSTARGRDSDGFHRHARARAGARDGLACLHARDLYDLLSPGLSGGRLCLESRCAKGYVCDGTACGRSQEVGVKKQAIVTAVFAVLVLSWSASSFAQGSTEPYSTNLGLRYDFFSHAFEESSFLGFGADVTRMLGGFAGGGGWGAGGGVEFEKFESSVLKEFEAYVHAQGKATGQKEMSPFGRFGIGVTSDSGFNEMMLDFRGGVDFKLKPNAEYLISVMVSIKRVLSEFEGFNVMRLSVGVVLPLAK